jgi:carboxymethylenebutenolidase
MPDVKFDSGGGTASGYLAEPSSGSGPATIVLQEWWGLEQHIRNVCDRFAAEGFFALAPDLYHGESTTKPSEAQQKMMALSMQQAETDMCAAADFLSTQPGVQGSGVGSVGFCLGGGLSVWALATCPAVAAAVSYYYVLPHAKPDFATLKGPVLGHFGGSDEFVSTEAANELESELRDAGADVAFHHYDGATHAFFNDIERPERVGKYDPQAAELSWERTVGFLRNALGASAPGAR